jgi:hypothetical protein
MSLCGLQNSPGTDGASRTPIRIIPHEKVAWIISVALLLVTDFLGLYNGRNELGDWTRLQMPLASLHIPPS